jgi:hypothetical protein
MTPETIHRPAVPSNDSPLPWGSVSIYFVALIAVSVFAFRTNEACLFFDWDGVAWNTKMGYFHQFASSFPFTSVDPLQGMLNLFYSAYADGLPHEMLWSALFSSPINKVATHVVYAAYLFASSFLLCRAVGFDRTVSIAVAVAMPLLTLPYFYDTAIIDPVYALNPNYLYTLASLVLSTALFWFVDARSWRKFLILTVAILALLVIACRALPYHSTLMVLGGVPFWIGALFGDRDLRTVGARMLSGFLILIGISATGLLNYIYALGAYNINAFFYNEVRELPSSGEVGRFDLLLQLSDLHDVMVHSEPFVIAGLIGAGLIARRGNPRPMRVFAVAYICSVTLFVIVHTAFAGHGWQQLTGLRYKGPPISRMLYFLLPFCIVFSVVAAFGVLHGLSRAVARVNTYFAAKRGGCHPGPLPLTRHPASSLVRGCLILLLGTTAALALRNNPGVGVETCGRPYFSPLRETPITAYLRERIGIHPGSTFNGAVATFYDTRGKSSTQWADLVTADWVIWSQTGNDMRSVGLWRSGIPTLLDANAAITPTYFLMTAELLARPTDKHLRFLVVFTQPEPRALALWGVRYLITDYPLGFATERLQMEVQVTNPPYFNTPLRLYELPEANVGNYSPTGVVGAGNAAETLALMRLPEFDGRRTVITDTAMQGSFTPATGISLTVVRGGVDLRASGGAESLLVLPIQYSHCWQIERAPGVSLFRANLLQLGVRFSGAIEAQLRFKFGPFWNSSCRLDDVSDMHRLRVSDGRNR